MGFTEEEIKKGKPTIVIKLISSLSKEQRGIMLSKIPPWFVGILADIIIDGTFHFNFVRDYFKDCLYKV